MPYCDTADHHNFAGDPDEWKAVTFIGDYPQSADEAFNRYVSGVANSEAKAVTMLSLGTEPKTKAQLYEEVRDRVQADDFDHSTPFSYCENSLEDVGSVARGKVTTDGGRSRTAYAVSQFGDHAKPVAAYQTWWINQQDDIDSLYDLFSSTQSPGDTRSPTNRARILIELVENPGMRPAAFEEQSGMHQDTISKHLKQLDEDGWLDQYHNQLDPTKIRYEIGDLSSEFTHYRNYRSMTADVIDYIEETADDTVTLSEVRDATGTHDGTLGSVLKHLDDEGVLDRMPVADISEKGLKAGMFLDTVSQYFEELEEVTDVFNHQQALDIMDMPDPIADVWQVYQEDRRRFDREWAAPAWDDYRSTSPYTEKLSAAEGRDIVFDALGAVNEAGEPALGENIVSRLDIERGKSWMFVRLRELENEEILESEPYPEDKRKKVWRLA